MSDARPSTQLCLQFSVPGDPGAGLRLLTRALSLARFSTVILSSGSDQPLDATTALPLVECVQTKDIAALIYGDAQLARALRADGVHLSASQNIAAAYAEARDVLGNRFIVGADAGFSRHDAMALAEAGCDYIAFGIAAHAGDRFAAAEHRLDLCAWWAEIFEIPVMALDVDTAHDVAALSAARTDFVAIRPLSSRADVSSNADDAFEAQIKALSAAITGASVASVAVQ